MPARARAPQPPESIRAIDELGDYFTAEIEKRRSNPGPDLVSALVAAHDEGDVMSAADLLSFVTLLLVAGNETTTNLIGNGTLALGRHPGLGRLPPGSRRRPPV